MALRPTRPERPRRSLTGANPRPPEPRPPFPGADLARIAAKTTPARVEAALKERLREMGMHADGSTSPPLKHLSFPKTPPLRSQSYLRFVRDEPCCSCSTSAPSDPHHFGPRGIGQKTDDFRVVPLCRACHDEFHARGTVPAAYDFNQSKDATVPRVLTERLFYRTQVDLLVRWIRTAEGQQGKG